MTDFHQWREAMAAKEQEDPLLCGIAARVDVAIERIQDGRPHEALSALKQIQPVLPKYHENNKCAARAAANAARLLTRSLEDDSFVNHEEWVHGGFARVRLERLKEAQDGKD